MPRQCCLQCVHPFLFGREQERLRYGASCKYRLYCRKQRHTASHRTPLYRSSRYRNCSGVAERDLNSLAMAGTKTISPLAESDGINLAGQVPGSYEDRQRVAIIRLHFCTAATRHLCCCSNFALGSTNALHFDSWGGWLEAFGPILMWVTRRGDRTRWEPAAVVSRSVR